MCGEYFRGPLDEICSDCGVEVVFGVVSWGAGVVELNYAGVEGRRRGSRFIAGDFGDFEELLDIGASV